MAFNTPVRTLLGASPEVRGLGFKYELYRWAFSELDIGGGVLTNNIVTIPIGYNVDAMSLSINGTSSTLTVTVRHLVEADDPSVGAGSAIWTWTGTAATYPFYPVPQTTINGAYDHAGIPLLPPKIEVGLTTTGNIGANNFYLYTMVRK